MTAKEKARQELTTCRDCVYGDVYGGINRFCSEWPDRVGIVDADFFCDKALRRGQTRQDPENAKKG